MVCMVCCQARIDVFISITKSSYLICDMVPDENEEKEKQVLLLKYHIQLCPVIISRQVFLRKQC